MKKKELPLPKYQMVKDYVLLQIKKKKIGKDGRIPSESEFSKTLDVSSITVRKAMAELVNEGIIYRVRGKGSFVVGKESEINNFPSYVTLIIDGNEIYDNSYMQIIKGIQSYLSLKNCKLVIEFIEKNFEQEQKLILKLIQSDNHGLLIYSRNPNAAKVYLKEIRKKSIPFVMLDRIPSGYAVNCITSNNHDGAYGAVQYLIEQGHHHIGFIACDFHLSTEVERFNGYRQAILDASLVLNNESLFFKRVLDYNKLLAQIKKEKLTALFCANDRRALDVIERLEMLGVNIPEQISIMGFDDFESSKFARVPLSTVMQDFAALGYEAAKLLLESYHVPSHNYKKVLLSTELIIRESTRKI
ncbi:arabinose metabolism transcriptional repressor [Bacillus sp. J14TS2]|uniref:substrate-binding domain-containing protein n=1 Tax=Bacillus sp. J14TS2 TaxID=2807188 RepID=UPI001B1F5038|nr:GntR family transcriptional regulator [Bacillus sp. J14TS2]GIN71508.1 arabinose metabolism transcriptional repressor [Bacillus sp. J14TS2]